MSIMREIKPSAVLVSDIHVTHKRPINRIDDYLLAIEGKLQFINGLAQRYNIPVIAGGDITDKWNIHPEAISVCVRNMRKWYGISGNHDLPYHNKFFYGKSSMNVLEEAKSIINIDGLWELSPNKDFIMFGAYWDFKPEDIPPVPKKFENLPKLLVVHEFVWKKKMPFPNCKSPEVDSFIKKYPQFDCIHVGDNHVPFTHKTEDQLVINCGSMMRIEIGQIDFKPRVYLWYAETNEFKKVYLPIEDNVFAFKDVERKKEEKQRIELFVNNLKNSESSSGLNFKYALRKYLMSNDVEDNVKKYINIILNEE